MLQLKLCR